MSDSGQTPKYPDELAKQWLKAWALHEDPAAVDVSLEQYIARKACDWQREQDAKTAAVIAEENREWSGTYSVAKSIESSIRSGGSHD